MRGTSLARWGGVMLIVTTALLWPGAAAHASSSAIATGASTADGRPVAWKNRDHWSTPDGWKVFPYHYQADGSSFGSGDRYTARFNYTGITAHGSSGVDPHTGITIPWAGANDRGLGLVQVAGHTLTSEFARTHGFPVSQDLERGMTGGFLNHLILSRCEHVDEVEQLLRDTNDGGGFNGSFARNTSTIISVFDRWGNAAIFEIDGDSFTRDNITREYYPDENGFFSDPHIDWKDLPNPADGTYSGFDWRTNFSKVNWTKENGFPYFVDNHITSVVDNEIVNEGDTPDGIHDWEDSTSAVRRHTRVGIRMDDPHPIDYRYFIQKNVGSRGLGTKWYMETLSRSIGDLPSEPKPTGWHVNRNVSTFGVVLVGNKIGDPYEGKLTTIWVALGEPAVSVFVPIFPFAGAPPAELPDMYAVTNEKRKLVYDYDSDESCGQSCGRNGNSTINTDALVGPGGYYGEGGIQQYVFGIENWAFALYDAFMADLRQSDLSEAELRTRLADWQQEMARTIKAHYIAGTIPEYPALQISEVLYNPITPGTTEPDEMVELYNPNPFPVEAGGYRLADNRDTFTIPAGSVIAPGGYLTITREDGALFAERHGRQADVTGMNLILGNTSDIVTLYDPAGRKLDEVAWGGFIPGWDLQAGSGWSLHRAGPESTPASWVVGDPTPGSGVPSDSPAATLLLNPAQPDGANGWYVSGVSVDWSAAAWGGGNLVTQER